MNTPITQPNGKAVGLAPTATATKVSKVYQHWADGDATTGSAAEWNNNILSANKSDYFEGEVIPNVYYYAASNNTPLVQGQSYSFNVSYNYYQGTSNAGGFAYMTTYNADRQPPTGITGVAPTADAVQTNGGGMQGQFYSVHADVTSVSAVRYTQSGGNIDAQVTVTFTYTGATTTSGGAEFYFGLMVAQPGMVTVPGQGPTDGANAWTGGSLQTTVDIGGSGATSIQLAPSAIIVGEIDGMKYEDVNGDGTRDANGVDDITGNADDERGLAGWTIFLDVNNNGALDAGERSTVTDASGNYSFSVTPDADPLDADNDPYIVREVQQTGWVQSSTPPGPITITTTSPMVTGVDFGNQRYLPALTIAKEATVPGGTADVVGEIVSYTIAVRNTGNQALTGVTVTDPFVSNLQLLSDDASSDGELDLGETWTYTATHAVTQDEIDAGGLISNTATADSAQTEPVTDDASVPVEQRPAMTIAKEASVPGGTADVVDEIVSYTIAVRNTGNQTLTGVTVSDPFVTDLQLIEDDASSDGELDVDEVWRYTASHEVTQQDIDDNGTIDNTATADSQQTEPVSASASVPVEQRPALSIAKAAVVPGGTADRAGEVIAYTIAVTNTGTQTLTGVTVADPFVSNLQLLTSEGTDDQELDVGETWFYSATHTVTQQEIDAGIDITNTAIADSTQTEPVSDDAAVPVQQKPAMVLDKALASIGGDNDLADAVDDLLNYTVTVFNTGNQTLTGVTVTDPLTQLSASIESLAPGTAYTWTTSYKLTQDDLDDYGGGDGMIDNTATASSTQTAPTADSERVPVFVRPSLSIDKAIARIDGGNGNAFADAPDDLLHYTITVKNEGTVTLENVVTTDQPNGDVPTVLGVIARLAPQQSFTYETVYKLTQADIDNNGHGDGYIDNQAQASYSHLGVTRQVDDEETVPVVRSIALGLDEQLRTVTGGNGNALADWAGDVLNFNFAVTNAGNVTLHNVRVRDSLTGLDTILPSIAPFTTVHLGPLDGATYTLQQSDLDANGTAGSGRLSNVSTVTSDETGALVVSDSEAVTLVYRPRIDLIKSVSVDGGLTWADANTPINVPELSEGSDPLFKFFVKNVGNITLPGVLVTDSSYDLNGGAAGEAHDFGALAPDESKEWVFSGATYQSGLQADTATATVVGMPTISDVDNAYYLGV